MRNFPKIFIAVVMLLLSHFAMNAQTTGSLTGTVNDPKGDAVPGASVTLRNAETGEERTATTNDKGVFTVGQLPPGTYTVTVENAGFKKAVATNVKVDVSSDASITIGLEIGALGETVT